MGLLNKLQNNGSPLSIANGGPVATNPLATQQSQMHNVYSLSGANASLVNSQYQQYIDGAVNILPKPSLLDLDGVKPTTYSSAGPTEGHY